MTRMQIFLACALTVGCFLGATGAYISTPLANAKRLSEDENFTETNKYGSVYKKYLISSFAENNDFFDYVYKWWYNEKNHKGRFEKITKGSGSDDPTSIQKTCGDAYKEPKVGDANSKIKKYGSNDSVADSDFREEDIGTLCSAWGYRIKTIAEAEEEYKYEEGTYGKKYKDKLVSTYATGTGDFGSRGYNGEKDWESNTSEKTAFEKIFKKKKEDYEGRSKRRLRYSRYDVPYNLDKAMMRECRKAYHIKEEDKNPLYPKEQVLKYCALIPEETQGNEAAK